MLHETLPNWEKTYAALALSMASLGAWIFNKSNVQDGFLIYLALFGGIVLAASGSIVVERYYQERCLGFLSNYDCNQLPLLEEILETLGFTFAASAALALWRSLQKPHRYISVFAALWLGLLIFSTWVQPALEAQFFAHKTNLLFERSPLVLTAYRLNGESFRAAERLSLDLYWQTGVSMDESYGYTVNLLDPLTGESLWRENITIAYPASSAWFPGIIYRSHYEFTIPDTLETPLASIFTIALWSREGDTYHNYQAVSTSLPVFAEKFPVVDRIAFLSPVSEFSPAYRFANGILLAEPELLRENEREYHLNLGWSTEAVISDSLGYFIHFLGQDGQENLILDRQPFDNRFSTDFWLLGMVERDEIILSLPEDATGSYHIQMGLFDGENRIVLSTILGNPMPENSIPLGTVSIP